MNYKNYPMVSRVIFGRGSFNQLAEIVAPHRKNTEAPFIFLVDDVFKGNSQLTGKIPVSYKDEILY
ncbi:MAG: alcohol dehydrogenase, partial [Winogradskyella sp.]|nr:alcohol dehydrogenase [Winogradskyella sp.]